MPVLIRVLVRVPVLILMLVRMPMIMLVSVAVAGRVVVQRQIWSGRHTELSGS
jgi:hypothetical protein